MRFVVVLALLAACKGKPSHRPPPPDPGSATWTGSGPRPAPDIVLPAGPGTPPVKTTKPLPPDKMRHLATLAFPGFRIEPKQLDPERIEIRHVTEDHPAIAATVAISHCFDCIPLELPRWQERTEALKLFIPTELKKDAATEFTVGVTDLHGAPLIFTYQLGATATVVTNAYVLYYNDGINQIRVVAEYADVPATKPELTKSVPREDLENVAKSFLDIYTHAW